MTEEEEAEFEFESDPSVFQKTEVEADQVAFLEEETIVPEFTPEEISERLLNGGDPTEVSADAYPAVFSCVMHYREGRMNALDVDGAEKADRVLIALRRVGAMSLLQGTRDDRDASFSRRISIAQESEKRLEKRYCEHHEQLAVGNAERIAALKERHENERVRFDEGWTTPGKTRMFMHATNLLRSMRVRNIWLMKAGRYEDQRLVEKAVSEREQWETEEQARAMLMQYDVELRALAARQAQEMSALMQANESRVLLLKKAQNRDLLAARQRIENIENEWKIQKESAKFIAGARRRVRRARSGPSIAGPRSMTLNMAQIATIELPPLLSNLVRRPQCYTSAALRKSH
jgi:hypothetical protein